MGNDARGEVFLGRYHCLERLGSGPLGETWRARVYGLGGFERELAVKRLHDRLCADAGFLACFVRAANAAAQLQSDHLCGVQEVDRDGEGRYYLVTDLAPGLSLALLCELLAASGSRLDRKLALQLTLDVVDALLYAHGRTDLGPTGVLHLGLCPDEIMIDVDGQVRVLGIGLTGALRTPGWTADSAIERRLGYLAPEVVCCRPVNPAADVFSVAAILHQLTGGADDDTTLHDMIAYAGKSDLSARLSSLRPLREALAQLVEDPPGARRRLGQWVARYVPAAVLPPLPVGDEDWDQATPVVDVGPSWNDGLVWEGGSGAIHLEPLTDPDADPAAYARAPGPVREDALTHEVRMPDPDLLPMVPGPRTPVGMPWYAPTRPELAQKPPEPQPMVPVHIPSPPTLPLSAMRSGVPRRRVLVGAALSGIAVAAVVLIGVAVRTRPRAPAPVPLRAQRTLPIPGGVGGGPSHEIDPPLSVGEVDFATEPPGARVFVDGVERGVSPIELTLPPGNHYVAFLAEGRQLVRQTVEVGETGRRIRAELAQAEVLPPEISGPAALMVSCQTRDLRIFVDGIDTGTSCSSESPLMLAPGRHRLGLYLPASDQIVTVQKEASLKAEHTRRIYLKY